MERRQEPERGPRDRRRAPSASASGGRGGGGRSLPLLHRCRRRRHLRCSLRSSLTLHYFSSLLLPRPTTANSQLLRAKREEGRTDCGRRIGTRTPPSLTRLKAFLFGLFLGLSSRGSILLRSLSLTHSDGVGHGHVGSAPQRPRRNSSETAVGRRYSCPAGQNGVSDVAGDKRCGGKER